MRQPSHSDISDKIDADAERVSARLARGEERFAHIEEKLDRLLAAVSSIPEIQADLAEVKGDTAKTKEIVEAWAAVKNVGRFMKWTAGIVTAIGVILTGIVITIKLAAAYLVR